MNELIQAELEQVAGGWSTIQELMDELWMRDAFPVPGLPVEPNFPIDG